MHRVCIERMSIDAPPSPTSRAAADAPIDGEASPSNAPTWGWYAALALVGLLTFGQTLGYGFVTADDTQLIVANPHVRAWWQTPLAERLLTPEFHYATPVALASFAFDFAWGGGKPWAFHLTNLALHVGCALLVLRALGRRVGAPIAFAGAALFLVHPAQVEAVSFVTQRKDVLAALFSLLLLGWVTDAPARRRPALAIFGAAALAALAGLSKPTGTLVGASIALTHWNRENKVDSTKVRRIVLTTGCLTGLMVLALDVRQARAIGQVVDWTPLTAGERVGRMAATVVHYAGVLLAPLDPSPRSIPPARAPLATFALAALLVVAVGAWLARSLRRGQTLVALGLAWFAVAYLPSSNAVSIARYVADGYLYVPMVGVAFVFAALLGGLDARLGHRRLLRVAGVATLTLGGAMLALVSSVSSRIWRDEESLFAYVYQQLPLSDDAYDEYRAVLLRAGKPRAARALALDHFGRAVARWPSSLGARQGLLMAQLAAGEFAAARANLESAPPAPPGSTALDEMWLAWADAAGDRARARAAMESIVATNPRHPVASRLAAERQGPLEPRAPR